MRKLYLVKYVYGVWVNVRLCICVYSYIFVCIFVHVWMVTCVRVYISWRSKDKLISDVLRWTPTYGRAKAGWPARTYIQQLCEDTGCNLEDLPEAMSDREKWRERVRDIRAGGTTWWWWWWLFCADYIANIFKYCAYLCVYICVYVCIYVSVFILVFFYVYICVCAFV